MLSATLALVVAAGLIPGELTPCREIAASGSIGCSGEPCGHASCYDCVAGTPIVEKIRRFCADFAAPALAWPDGTPSLGCRRQRFPDCYHQGPYDYRLQFDYPWNPSRAVEPALGADVKHVLEPIVPNAPRPAELPPRADSLTPASDRDATSRGASRMPMGRVDSVIR